MRGLRSMTIDTKRIAMRGLVLGSCAAALAGCMGPTYGTGVSQGGQLLSDLDSMASLGGSDKGAAISYAPRPELVKPENRSVLPAPRESVAAADGQNWPESPEQRSARLRAAAPNGSEVLPASFASSAKQGYTDEDLQRTTRGARSEVGRRDQVEQSWLSPKEMGSQRQLAAQAAADSKQGSPTQRKYLSEPPLAYRQPSDAAPVGDPGPDEDVKERRAQGTSTIASKIRNILPF